MPRQAKEVDPSFEEDSATKKFRCLVCKEADPANLGAWIARSSLAGHLRSAVHQAHVLSKQQQMEALQAKAATLRDTYSGPEASLPDSEPQQPTFPLPSMFDGEIDSAWTPTYADYAAAGLRAPIIPTNMELHNPEEERNRFSTEDEEDELDDEMAYTHGSAGSNYYPYPNKVNMLLDILDNLPRLRMSSNQFKMILWIMKECNVSNVLSYNSFRKMQNGLRTLCGSEPKAYTSSVGNRFFVNDIRETIARDFSNPEVAKHLQFCPEETAGPITEVWQAERWKEYKPSELTPMYVRGLRQFYIEELAALRDDSYVIPLAWIVRGGVLCADCLDVTPAPVGALISTNDIRSVLAMEFNSNYDDIIQRVGDNIKWADDVKPPEMPNPLRKLAKGDDLYVVMVPIWADDVSGNKSKQYNKHINMYLANSNLPGRLLQQEYFVRFVSTSPHATSPEQFSAIKEQIVATHTEPIPCYNAETKRNCRVILRAPSLPADNPQQSEEASHMGGNANCGCRRCKAGGPHEKTESDEGYHSMHYAGVPRFAAQTKHTLEEQICLAMYGVEAPITRLQTATGVKDKVAQYWIDILLQKSREMKSNSPGRTADSIKEELETWLSEQPGDKVNPLLDIAGLDPNRDTPVEILHTILLGIVKYVWYTLHSGWSEAQRDLFVIRLQSTDIGGLTIPPIRTAYMMQYRNGLIGKHFKTLMQTMLFHVHDLVSPELFTLVKAVSELGAMLWVHEIDNIAKYAVRIWNTCTSFWLTKDQDDLTILIGNVLDVFGDQDPAKILVKIKLHLLPHIIEDAVRFGPPIRNATEVFECFNAIFRLCSILSNHQAPSRDIALKFAGMDRMKHIVSGGFWKVGDEWVCAGPKVLSVLRSMPIIQRHLGWVPLHTLVPGKMCLAAESKAPWMRWKDTHACSPTKNSPPLSSVRWRAAIGFTAQSGDFCGKNSWIFARDSEGSVVVGRIREVIVPESCPNGVPSGLVTLDRFAVSEALHPEFGMPVLQKPIDPTLHLTTVLATFFTRFCTKPSHPGARKGPITTVNHEWVELVATTRNHGSVLPNARYCLHRHFRLITTPSNVTTKDKKNRHKSSRGKSESSHKSSHKSTGDVARKGRALRDNNHSRRSPAEEQDTGDVGGDTALRARVRQLEATLATTKSHLETAEDLIEQGAAPDSEDGNTETIPHPDKLSAVTVKELKALLKMDKLRWNAMRVFTRHRLHAGDLCPELVWKKQDTLVLGVISRANRRDVDRPNTYVGRKAVERRRRRATPLFPTPSGRESSHPPTPGPSRRRSTSPTSPTTAPGVPKPRPLQRATDSDSGPNSGSGSGTGAGSGSQSGSDDDDNEDDMVLAGDENGDGHGRGKRRLNNPE
ncbi:hypothetical protein B0H14DRAFT_3580816 [Mycena olivaceomarginata]|nr:hypothetical protein B0H14DRAFT_3580816 [Mycena olivaceomarginata]